MPSSTFSRISIFVLFRVRICAWLQLKSGSDPLGDLLCRHGWPGFLALHTLIDHTCSAWTQNAALGFARRLRTVVDRPLALERRRVARGWRSGSYVALVGGVVRRPPNNGIRALVSSGPSLILLVMDHD